MQKHFVIFFSPGTFFAEETELPIDSWNVEKAKAMADTVVERYNATPWGFCFTTRERKDDDLDSREVKRSPVYHLGGKVETLEEIKARNDPKDSILVSNMEGNGWGAVVVNTNSWKSVQPLREGDVVLDYTPPKKVKAA
jgi:hypothetical protein